MGMIGTFDAFTTARLGIYAAQKGLSVTGNNISNLNTLGYTRQVIDQVSFKAGANDMYRSMMDNHIGSGALVTGISQIRDPYLDIRYRNTNSEVGYYDTMLGGLQYIKAVLDEVGKGVASNTNEEGDGLLFAQLQSLRTALEQLSLSPIKDNDDLARGAADALVKLFNTYATELEKLRVDMDTSLKEDVNSVNDILVNIRNLNKSIREAEICGDKALEMRDERNRQIDELSNYMNIKVEYTMEDVGAGVEVEKLTIYLGNANPDPNIHTDEAMLIDGVYAAQLSIPEKMPLLNPDFGSTDPDKADLADFLYLKASVDANGDPVMDANGDPVYEGTNEAEDAVQVPNDTYNMEISRLVNAKGEEWKDVDVTWVEANGGQVATKAVYEMQITGTSGWADGDEFEISGQTFTIGAKNSISADDANNAEKLAAFLAKNLTNSDYTITAKGDTLVFKAKKAGAVGVGDGFSGPDAIPSLIFTPGTGGAANANVAFGAATETTKGVENESPDSNTPTTTIRDDGAEVTVDYRLINNKWYKMTTVTQYTDEVTLDYNDLRGSLQAMRELLTGKGNFSTTSNVDAEGNPINSDMLLDEGAESCRGLPYYQMSLDLLARQLATYYNSLNQGFMVNQDGNYIDENGKELILPGADGVDATVSKTNGLTESQKQNLINNGWFVKDSQGNPVLDSEGNMTADLDSWLADNGGFKPEGAGNLFSNSNDGDDASNITAANLSVSHSWYIGDVKIVPSHVQLFGEDGAPLPNTTQADNINHMISMMDQALFYDPRDLVPDAVSSKLFQGSFNDMFSNMNTILGEDQLTLNVKLNNDYTSLIDIDTSRDYTSGVDLNDEAMNMMQYQKAYTAACRLMTVIDSVLEHLINNTAM